ncbi:MAG: DUF4440 domain-containing protein [Chitinophagaceae bacterium]|nr:DUF4440 domain-containing protein [Chitinophagaceae bacterium]
MYSSLTEINQKILEAEKTNKPEMIRDLLGDDFLFRRANAVVVDKKTYLDQMSLISYSRLEQTSFEVIPMDPDSAFVILGISAKGTRPDNSEFEGEFKNVRFFRKVNDSWELYAWRNDVLRNGTPAALTDQDKFLGTVVISMLQERNLPERGRWQQVLFHAGARTHWHIHPEGQDLFVIAGKAIVVVKKDSGDPDVIHLNAGGQVHIPRGLLHWHGASKDSFMVHIAYNQFSHSNETSYWFDPVSEEQYAKAHELNKH